MNHKVRQRAMRSFLASLLQSNLTNAEMRELADDLTIGSFGKELGNFIQDAMLNLMDVDRKTDYIKSDSEQIINAHNIIARRRLSKSAVLQLMQLASPKLRLPQLNGTMKDILESYFAIATPIDRDKFLSILRGEPADPYLKGISRRD
jgi:hypothetical protein